MTLPGRALDRREGQPRHLDGKKSGKAPVETMES